LARIKGDDSGRRPGKEGFFIIERERLVRLNLKIVTGA